MTLTALLGRHAVAEPAQSIAAPAEVASSEEAARPCAEQSEQELLDWEQGKQLFVARKYAEAIRVFEKAYAICHKAIFLHNIAMSYQHAGQFQRAIEMYNRYLAESPEQRFRNEAQTNIRILKTLLDQRSTLQRELHRPLWRRPVLWAGVSAGVLAVTAGAIGLGLGLRVPDLGPQTLQPMF